MKMVRFVALFALAWLTGIAPSLAQSNVPFSTYVLGLPAVGSVGGSERMVVISGGIPKTMTPYQILSAVAGDCSFASPPTIICTKTNGASFAASATTDTTNAGNISSGVLAAARGGAGAISGALKANGSGVVSQAACADLSNGTASCSTDTTNASNISSGTLNTLRLPSPFTSGTRSGNTSTYLTASGTLNSGHVAAFDASGNVVDGGIAGAGSVTEQKNTAGTGLAVSGNCDNTTSNAGSPCQYALTSARQTLPTISLVTTGSHTGGFGANSSGTYTTPANVLWIEIELVGGGAGGNGGAAAGASCWNTSGSACTSPVYSAGGGASSGGGSIAGSGTCNIAALAGSDGQGGVSTTAGTSSSGGIGGSTPLGGAGVGVIGSSGASAKANTGSGGGGQGQSGVTANTSAGGGSGATCRVIINSPAATYTYAVGAKSTGGTGGGDGADGRITVIEHYGS